MEEDEEVVLKNSALYFHLLDSGFDDFESAEVSEKRISDTITDQCIRNDSIVKINTENYEYFEKFVNAIFESNLVFSDDVAAVNNFATPSKSCGILRSSYLKLFYQTSASSAICFLCSFYALRNRPVVCISLNLVPPLICIFKCWNRFYSYYKENKVVNDLIKIMKDFSLMLQKCVQFIQESEILAYNSISQSKTKLSLVGQPECFTAKWQIMLHLRNAAYDTLKSIILNLRTIITTLLKDFPIKPSVDELNFYLALLSEEDLHCSKKQQESISVDKLQKMKYVCLLLQSEFLKRLCFNLNPFLWRHQIPVRKIFEIIENLKNVYNQEYIRIKEVFTTYYTFEKPKDSKIPFHEDWIYKEAYTKICSVSLNLQSVLKASRNIEEVLETNRLKNDNYSHVISKLDDLSENLMKNYAQSKEVLEDFRAYVLRLKSKNTPKNNSPIPTQIDAKPDVTNKTSIFVGASDFRPPHPDEIFIGVSTQEQKSEAENLDEDYVISNKCSKLLISELKLALQDKAQEWKKREKIALQNKNLEDTLSEDEMTIEVMDTGKNCNENHVNLFDSIENLGARKFVSDSSDEDAETISHAMIFPARTSFAEKIAQASSQWALKTQDYIIDDDDCDDDEISD